jgi:hypothetical protein
MIPSNLRQKTYRRKCNKCGLEIRSTCIEESKVLLDESRDTAKGKSVEGGFLFYNDRKRVLDDGCDDVNSINNVLAISFGEGGRDTLVIIRLRFEKVRERWELNKHTTVELVAASTADCTFSASVWIACLTRQALAHSLIFLIKSTNQCRVQITSSVGEGIDVIVQGCNL